VYLDIDGDAVLARKFSLLLQSELVDTGIELKGRSEADIILSGKFEIKTEPRVHGVAVVQQEVTADNQTKVFAVCTSNFSNFGGDMPPKFPEGSQYDAAIQLKQRFSNAKPVYIDPAGNFSVMPEFPALFPKALQQEGFTVASTPAGSLADRVTLSIEKVSVTGPTLYFKLKSPNSNFNESGNHWAEGATKPVLPSGCTDRFNDFGTPVGELLLDMARDFVKSLRTSGLQ